MKRYKLPYGEKKKRLGMKEDVKDGKEKRNRKKRSYEGRKKTK